MKITIGPVHEEFEAEAEETYRHCIFGNGEHYVSMMVWTSGGSVVGHNYRYEHSDGRNFEHEDYETLEEALERLPEGVFYRAANDVKQFRTVEYPLALQGDLDLDEF